MLVWYIAQVLSLDLSANIQTWLLQIYVKSSKLTLLTNHFQTFHIFKYVNTSPQNNFILISGKTAGKNRVDMSMPDAVGKNESQIILG